MAEKKEAWKDLREAIDKVWFKPVEIRVLAVLAELEEQGKPRGGPLRRRLAGGTGSRAECCATGSAGTKRTAWKALTI